MEGLCEGDNEALDSLKASKNTKADDVYDRLTINITLDNFAKKLIIKILTSRIKATTVKIFTGIDHHISISNTFAKTSSWTNCRRKFLRQFPDSPVSDKTT
ncbi:hypothetical protein ANN_12726 [Periplaneta americana]|uniref:Uncharacterized protein n=1 Tax=Periplaneta americana TaxID=6978 RepID=A0ABQ8TK41_PERAM|nr:hypothetical protein ANN_12726 [Periplaneta americana]